MNRIAVAAVVLATLTVSACATGEPGASETPAESAPAQTPAPVASSDESTVIELPEGFPTADVPLIDGDLLIANDLSDGWSVWVASNDVANDFAAASELLVAVGYENTVNSPDGDDYFAAFAGEKYQVQVTAGDDATYGPAVTYTIYPSE